MEELSGLERELESVDLDSRSLGQKAKDLYFKPKGVEKWKNGRIYELLGVKKFKKLCEYIGHKVGKDNTYENNYFIWDRSPEGLKSFEKKTRFNEAVHLIPTAFCTLTAIGMYATGETDSGIFQTALAVLNSYPVILQRYNRTRIENVLDRMESKYVSAPSQK